MSTACIASVRNAPTLPVTAAMESVRIVVANSEVARIFEPTEGEDLRQIAMMANPLRTTSDCSGVGALVRTPPKSEPAVLRARREAEVFAQILSRHLAGICSGAPATRIYLLAEPSFLERLRMHMDAFTHACVTREIGGDCTARNAAFIRALLPRQL